MSIKETDVNKIENENGEILCTVCGRFNPPSAVVCADCGNSMRNPPKGLVSKDMKLVGLEMKLRESLKDKPRTYRVAQSYQLISIIITVVLLVLYLALWVMRTEALIMMPLSVVWAILEISFLASVIAARKYSVYIDEEKIVVKTIFSKKTVMRESISYVTYYRGRNREPASFLIFTDADKDKVIDFLVLTSGFSSLRINIFYFNRRDIWEMQTLLSVENPKFLPPKEILDNI